LSYLIDTNVISELRKGRRCDANVARWFDSVGDEEIFLSVLTIGELRRGVELIRRRDPVSAESLDTWLAQVLSTHAGRFLPVDSSVAEQWGELNVPNPVPVVDGLLAATAIVNGLTLATRNVGNIAGTGVPCLNPFDRTPSAMGRR